MTALQSQLDDAKAQAETAQRESLSSKDQTIEELRVKVQKLEDENRVVQEARARVQQLENEVSSMNIVSTAVYTSDCH